MQRLLNLIGVLALFVILILVCGFGYVWFIGDENFGVIRNTVAQNHIRAVTGKASNEVLQQKLPIYGGEAESVIALVSGNETSFTLSDEVKIRNPRNHCIHYDPVALLDVRQVHENSNALFFFKPNEGVEKVDVTVTALPAAECKKAVEENQALVNESEKINDHEMPPVPGEHLLK